MSKKDKTGYGGKHAIIIDVGWGEQFILAKPKMHGYANTQIACDSGDTAALLFKMLVRELNEIANAADRAARKDTDGAVTGTADTPAADGTGPAERSDTGGGDDRPAEPAAPRPDAGSAESAPLPVRAADDEPQSTDSVVRRRARPRRRK